jgi:sugar (pentulose or hexulose) kinase
MTQPPAAIGVDLGSSSARAIALDGDGTVVGGASAAYDGAETWSAGHGDPRAWLRAFETVVAELITTVEPAAVAVGGQSPTTVLQTGADAITCLHPAGATLDPHAQHGEQYAVLRSTHHDVRPMQLWDWVLAQCGAPPMQGRWPGDPPLTDYGEVIATGRTVGTAGGTGVVPKGTPLVPGAQDAYLAFWAAGIDEPGRGLDPGGRTGGLGVAVGLGSRPADMFAMPSAAAGVDIVGGPVSAHGLIMDWWAATTGRSVTELLELAATVPPGAAGVHALPYLEGERAPRWNRELRAELYGITSRTGPGEVARALLESTAYGVAHIARELAAHGVPLHTLVVGGSPARSPLWCAIKASVLEVPVEVPEVSELAAYGAALAAGAAIDWWPAPGAGRAGDWPRPATHVIEPEPCDTYRTGYRRFVALGDAAVARLARDHCEGVGGGPEGATPKAFSPEGAGGNSKGAH